MLAQVNGLINPPHRVLIVEDDAAIRKLYAEVLRHAGYQVDIAADGEAGWEMLHAADSNSTGYDLLITDNNMPKLSGAELIEKLRAAGLTLPIIMASSTVSQDCDAAKLAALLTKPFSLELLVKTVNEVLKIPDPGQGMAGSCGTGAVV